MPKVIENPVIIVLVAILFAVSEFDTFSFLWGSWSDVPQCY